MDHIESYIFPRGECRITDHQVLGVSLGGHTAWLSLFHESRVSAGIVVIGCADYTTLMHGRARLSKRPSFFDSPQPGVGFIGSKDFPLGLHKAVLKIDPASLLLGDYQTRQNANTTSAPSEPEQARLRPLIVKALGNKNILNLAGGSDKLVPYAASEPFLRTLKSATESGGWADGADIKVQDLVFPGVGHEVSHEMTLAINRFVNEHASKRKSDIKSHI